MKNNLGNYTHQVKDPERFIRFDLTEGDCWFKDQVADWFKEINIDDIIHYPDERIIKTKKLLARWLHMKEENIAIGSGSDELIEMIPNIFIKPKNKVLTVSPSFFRFIESSLRAGGEVATTRLDGGSGFEWSNKTIKRLIKKAKDKRVKLIWLASPNNPTGIDIPKHLLSEIIRLGKIVILDKVLNGFTKELREASQLIWNNPNLIVLSSFSKTFGLPGLRFGFAIGSADMIKKIESQRLPFNVAGPTLFIVEKLLLSLLGNKIKINDGLKFIEEREFLKREIDQLENIRLASSSITNFILLKSKERINLFSELLKKRILVTNLNKTVGIKNKNFVRLTIRDRKQNRILLEALKEIDNHFH